MILFRTDEMGRSYIKKDLIISKVYEYLKNEKPDLKILSIKSEENKIKIFLNGSHKFYNVDFISLQKDIISFLKKIFDINIFEVDIKII